ncbi:hypothetical protein, partial [Sinimarinibacterium flocculans]|uniref:hypothetical protein n=1 Tax=Sinimarinibacterium flocculans TaxID=985250 RepID=UPI00360B0C3C
MDDEELSEACARAVVVASAHVRGGALWPEVLRDVSQRWDGVDPLSRTGGRLILKRWIQSPLCGAWRLSMVVGNAGSG